MSSSPASFGSSHLSLSLVSLFISLVSCCLVFRYSFTLGATFCLPVVVRTIRLSFIVGVFRIPSHHTYTSCYLGSCWRVCSLYLANDDARLGRRGSLSSIHLIHASLCSNKCFRWHITAGRELGKKGNTRRVTSRVGLRVDLRTGVVSGVYRSVYLPPSLGSAHAVQLLPCYAMARTSRYACFWRTQSYHRLAHAFARRDLRRE